MFFQIKNPWIFDGNDKIVGIGPNRNFYRSSIQLLVYSMFDGVFDQKLDAQRGDGKAHKGIINIHFYFQTLLKTQLFQFHIVVDQGQLLGNGNGGCSFP